MFERNVKQGRLHFATRLEEGIFGAEIIFLALPTPPDEDGSADLKYILGVADDLSKIVKDYKVIVDKSTVPVGTAEKVHSVLANRLDESLFDVVSNPEFLREGVAVDDFMKPDRVVIGGNSEKALRLMQKLYEPFVRQGNPVIIMDRRSAEMTKYAANSYLATRISFMNEIGNLCDNVGANVDMVRRGMGSENRIGKRFLFPGIGYGGSCFPKDVQALKKTAGDNDYNFRILESVMAVNDKQKNVLAYKVIDYFNGDLRNKKIAIWGLAFKPNTDDIREASALRIIELLLDEGAVISVYDPEAMGNVKALFGNKITFGQSHYDILEDSEALLLCTEWSVFRSPDFNLIKEKMKRPLLFDGRNVFDPIKMNKMSFEYISIGRPI